MTAETPPEQQVALGRRELLRMALAVPVGAAVGAGLQQVTEVTEEQTGRPPLTEEETAYLATYCNPKISTDCAQEHLHQPTQWASQVMFKPLGIEACRTVVSAVVDAICDLGRIAAHEETQDFKPSTALDMVDHQLRQALRGDRRRTLFTRRDAGLACAYAVINPYMSPTTAPAAGAVYEVGQWWLQRRLGTFANLSSAMAFAFLRLRGIPRRLPRNR